MKRMLWVIMGAVALYGFTVDPIMLWPIVVLLIILPPSLDPAINFKEWLSKK